MKIWKQLSALILLGLLGAALCLPAMADGYAPPEGEQVEPSCGESSMEPQRAELCPHCGEQSVFREERWSSQWQVLSRSECVHGNPDYNDRYEQQGGTLYITCPLCGWSSTSTITRTRTFCPHLNRVVPTSVLLEP